MRPPPAPTPPTITVVTDALPSARDILDTLTFRAGFNTTTVLLATTLLGLAAGVVGLFALLRKRSMMADVLSHAALPGIGAAFLAAPLLGLAPRSLPVLLAGAAIAAVLGTLCVHAVTRYTRLRDDAAMALVLSVFFGAGIVLMSYIQKNAPDQSAGLNKFLFGQTAAMHARDVALMASLAAVSLAAAALLFKELALVCFNDAFARVDGWPVSLLDLALMTLVVLVTVAGLQAVGILLVVAMLIVPPAAARFWTDRLWLLVVLSGLLGAFCGYLGAAVSALLPRKPAGAVIVLTAGAVFALSMLLAPRRGVLAAALRAARFRLRIAADHLLEAAAERADAALPAADARALARTRRWPAWLTPLIRRSLRRRNLATFDTTAVRLTPAGLARGLRVRRNHLLWEQYLVSHADIAPGHVDWSADQVEHVLPDDLIDRLEAALAARGISLPPPTAPRAAPHA